MSHENRLSLGRLALKTTAGAGALVAAPLLLATPASAADRGVSPQPDHAITLQLDKGQLPQAEQPEGVVFQATSQPTQEGLLHPSHNLAVAYGALATAGTEFALLGLAAGRRRAHEASTPVTRRAANISTIGTAAAINAGMALAWLSATGAI